jgi:chemotaxis protein MotB
MNRPLTSLRFAMVALALGGCVKKSTHQVVVADLARARVDQQALREEMAADNERWQARLAEETRARAEEQARLAERIADLEARLERTEERRLVAESRFSEARTEIDRLELLLSQRGSEYRRLEQRLRALTEIEREVRQRNAIYEEVLGRFRSLIDAGRLSVAINRGRLVIQLPQDILFQSGSARLSADGIRTITEVGTVLAEFDDRRFQVEGHTDNVPIATDRFPSNWELSTARALSVVHVLVDQGVPAENLSGAGYGEFQPVAGYGEFQPVADTTDR